MRNQQIKNEQEGIRVIKYTVDNKITEEMELIIWAAKNGYYEAYKREKRIIKDLIKENKKLYKSWHMTQKF